MKFLRLIARNALRNRLRTFLTVAGSGFLIFVLVFMQTALSEMQAWEGEGPQYNRVAVQHSMGLAQWLPIGLEAYLRGPDIQPHAKHVMKLNWFGGYYQDKMNFFANFGADHAHLRDVWPELVMADDAYAKYCAQKDSCLVGQSLATKFKWKVGDRITLLGTIYPCDIATEIVGTFKAKNVRQEEQLFFRWDYLDELMKGRRIVGTYWLRGHTPGDIPKLKDLIDTHTRNSSDPTETFTEKEFGQQFMAMMGNIQGLVVNLGFIVLVIMVLMIANTIAMSARERVTEIAVLRTLGFTPQTILLLILGESVLVTMTGALLSLGLGLLLFNVAHLSPAPQFFPYFLIKPATVAISLSAAAVAGVLSAMVPAIRASRRKIVDGLRQVV